MCYECPRPGPTFLNASERIISLGTSPPPTPRPGKKLSSTFFFPLIPPDHLPKSWKSPPLHSVVDCRGGGPQIPIPPRPISTPVSFIFRPQTHRRQLTFCGVQAPPPEAQCSRPATSFVRSIHQYCFGHSITRTLCNKDSAPSPSTSYQTQGLVLPWASPAHGATTFDILTSGVHTVGNIIRLHSRRNWLHTP